MSIVDIVSDINCNLYAELLREIDAFDPAVGESPPPMFAATLKTRYEGQQKLLDAWYYPLTVGQPLPTLPIRLRDDLSVPLELEATYEDCCRTLRIR